MVNVICMKWGRRYDATYVNRLRNMARRNLSLEHRFVCFTEDSRGIDSGIEVKPLPELKFPPGPERFWNKLGIFSKPLADITGRVLCLDLDVVIAANIDCFFEIPGNFFMIREYRKKPGASLGNMSACRFEAGAHPELVQQFEADPAGVAARHKFDQDFVSATIQPMNYWPGEWCPSFKKQCLPPVPRCYFERPHMPSGAKIIVFHGHPKPPDAAHGCFVRGGIRFCRATPWVAEKWR